MSNAIRQAREHRHYVSKTQASKIEDYLHQILHYRASETIHKIPLNINGPTYSKRSRFQIELSVNAQGNVFYAFPPSFLCAFTATSGNFPVIYVNVDGYNPSANNNSLGTIAALIDSRVTNANGTNITAGVFDAAQTTTCNIRATVAGVSPINRKGTIYIAEDRDSNWVAITGAQSSNEINNIVNNYTISNITKLYHNNIFDMSVNTTGDIATYHYIPEYTYSNPIVYRPAPVSTGGVTIGVDNCAAKIFFLIGSGLDTSCRILLNFEIIQECEVNIDQLNNYPVSYTNCYSNPDPYLQYLSSRREMVVTQPSQYSHKTQVQNLLVDRPKYSKEKGFLSRGQIFTIS